MVTVLILTIEVLCSYLLQSCVFTGLSVANQIPDLLMIVTVAAGYQNSRLTGMTVGFFSGLLLDIGSGGILGMYALFFMLLGYFSGHFNKYHVRKDLFFPLILITVSEFVVCTLMYVFNFLIKGDLHFLFYCKTVIIPKTVYTTAISVLYYELMEFLHSRVICRNEEDEAFLAPESIVDQEELK